MKTFIQSIPLILDNNQLGYHIIGWPASWICCHGINRLLNCSSFPRRTSIEVSTQNSDGFTPASIVRSRERLINHGLLPKDRTSIDIRVARADGSTRLQQLLLPIKIAEQLGLKVSDKPQQRFIKFNYEIT